MYYVNPSYNFNFQTKEPEVLDIRLVKLKSTKVSTHYFSNFGLQSL